MNHFGVALGAITANGDWWAVLSITRSSHPSERLHNRRLPPSRIGDFTRHLSQARTQSS